MDYYEHFMEVYEEAKGVGTVDPELLTALHTFLQGLVAGQRTELPSLQVGEHKVGVKWDTPTYQASVWLYADQHWEWDVTVTHTKPIGVSHWSHSGEPTYVSKNGYGPYYGLPDHVCKLIKIPEPFEKYTGELLSKSEYSTYWVTGKWDGPLSGYIKYKGKLHEYKTLEETECESRRLYGVYALPLMERIRVVCHKHWWEAMAFNKLFWTWHSFKIKMFGYNHKVKEETRTPIAYFEY